MGQTVSDNNKLRIIFVIDTVWVAGFRNPITLTMTTIREPLRWLPIKIWLYFSLFLLPIWASDRGFRSRQPSRHEIYAAPKFLAKWRFPWQRKSEIKSSLRQRTKKTFTEKGIIKLFERQKQEFFDIQDESQKLIRSFNFSGKQIKQIYFFSSWPNILNWNNIIMLSIYCFYNFVLENILLKVSFDF